jgi:hypothetical protein
LRKHCTRDLDASQWRPILRDTKRKLPNTNNSVHRDVAEKAEKLEGGVRKEERGVEGISE